MKAVVGRAYKHRKFPRVVYVAVASPHDVDAPFRMVVLNVIGPTIKLCAPSILNSEGEFTNPTNWTELSDLDVGRTIVEAFLGTYAKKP